ncbi:MAG TPA: histidine kinase [Candidatus Merdenecus merdavium]|nr:histidine kinase [Candidatus Merdenecus merdavium]
MKKLKYQTKFLLYHTGVMLLIILGAVGYFYHVVVDEMREKEEQNFSVITEKTANQLDTMFYEMDRMALKIAANPSIADLFQRLPEDLEDNYFKVHPIVTGEVKKILESYNFKHDGYSRICLYNNAHDFVSTSNRAVTERGILQFFESDTFDEMQRYFEEPAHFIYYKSPEPDILSQGDQINEDYFAVVREIKDYFSNGSQCGYIEVQESTEKIYEILSELGDGMYAEVRDTSGEVIYAVPEHSLLEEKVSYEREISLDNSPYTVRFSKSPTEYKQSVRQFYLVLMAVVIILMFFAIILEKILIRHLSKPLVELNRSLKSVTMDNLHVEISDTDSMDVILKLEESFNVMLSKLNHSMMNQIAAKTNEVKAQFFALQSQMNPHFLHNMLAIISMESQLDDNTKIPDICRRLGDILRYNSEMGDGYSTIENECASAENYMLLMKVRYEELAQYTIKIQDGMEKVRIPKLILQPICENCFQHGFKQVEPVWKIDITIWQEGQRWFLKVQDNGSGFSKDYLEEFQNQRNNMDHQDVNRVLENITIGGLCIPNIYMRLKIEYGEKALFQLYNESTGTVVLLGGEIND